MPNQPDWTKKLAPHVQAKIAEGAQLRLNHRLGGQMESRQVAPHVQVTMGAGAQLRLNHQAVDQVGGPQLAPHVQAAISAEAQAKLILPKDQQTGDRQMTPHVQKGISAAARQKQKKGGGKFNAQAIQTARRSHRYIKKREKRKKNVALNLAKQKNLAPTTNTCIATPLKKGSKTVIKTMSGGQPQFRLTGLDIEGAALPWDDLDPAEPYEFINCAEAKMYLELRGRGLDPKQYKITSYDANDKVNPPCGNCSQWVYNVFGAVVKK
ncbi:MAG: hypothetical protein GY835_23430 [bacterium]|nr:hypothetical protein [bacterium]